MNKVEAGELAQVLYRKASSVYVGKISVAESLGMDQKKLTDSGFKKVMTAFYPLVAEGARYPAIQKLYAEDKMSNK